MSFFLNMSNIEIYFESIYLNHFFFVSDELVKDVTDEVPFDEVGNQ